jgi:crotonobetainyl-CoA hydratase
MSPPSEDVSDSTGPAPVLTERDGNVLLVTINRPESRNAVNLAVTIALGDVLEEAEYDSDIRAVIITGTGDKSFCAGADLKALARGEKLKADDPARAAWGFAGYVNHPISKPTIAAVNGFALGGGTEIALASDLVVAADTASFGLPEVKRGIMAGAGGLFRLPRQIPPKVALEMILTGDPLSADQALHWGLVNKVVPSSQLLPAAMELAERICDNAPLAVQASKRVACGIVGGTIDAESELWRLNDAEVAQVMSSDDAKEGPSAFAERRSPKWTSR